MSRVRFFLPATLLITLFLSFPQARAQNLLRTNVSVSVENKPVAEVLKLIEQQGEFRFGYNSDLIPGDSIVTISIRSVSVRQVLDMLLKGRFQYKEKGGYIIIQRASGEKYYYITGQVFDRETDKEVNYASVYSRAQLVSALTDDAGFFKLRLRNRNFPVTLSLSRIGYADTAIVIHSEMDSGIKIFMHPKAVELDTLVVTNSRESNAWLTRFFVSSRLRAQSRNISKFFVSLPFQASLAPGLSTHGRLSPQITNKFSLNIYGGYTAGVNGVEIGGLFNISKKDAKYLQMATTFNAVSGDFKGLQAGGVYNQVLDSLSGVQISGAVGFIKSHLKGFQLSGIVNRVAGSADGVQTAAGANLAKGDLNGAQISFLGNITGKRMRGLQLAGFLNYARFVKGVQIGMINLADSSSGYSIGLINIVRKGSGSVSFYANELMPWNVAWRSGNSRLYNILTMGLVNDRTGKAYQFGFGFGHGYLLSKNLRLHTEILHQAIYLGRWSGMPVLYRLQTGLNLKLSKRLSVSGGPSFCLFSSRQQASGAGYQSFTDKGFFHFKAGQKTDAWLGWQASLNWHYGRY